MAYKPDFTITQALLFDVAKIEAAKQIIENSPLVPKWERAFQNKALARTIHHSIAIEGNALSLKETEKVIAGESLSTIRVRDIQEILNYRDVINYLAADQTKTLSLEFLFEIHKRLGKKILDEKKLGKLRTNPALIINSRTSEVVFDPPDIHEIEPELEDLIEWDQNEAQTMHPIIKAAIIHFEFVRIHPFVDLNGRSSRILATWSLGRDGYDIKNFFSLEEYYDQDTKSYYNALDTAHSGDLTYWIEYFARGVALELERVKLKVLELSKDRKLRLKAGQVALNERQIRIIEFLEETGEFQNKNFSQLFPDISDDTILRDLKDLMEKSIIKKKGRTKAAKYILQ